MACRVTTPVNMQQLEWSEAKLIVTSARVCRLPYDTAERCLARLPSVFRFMIYALDQFTDSLGEPLRDFSKGRLAAFFADPRASTWEDAHGVALNAQGLTLWQAWIALDPDAPREGRHVTIDAFDRVHVVREWEQIPDGAMLSRIVQFVLESTGRQ